MVNQNEVKAAMEHALEHLKKELKALRTGRANPAILDNVLVEVYGTKIKLKEISNVTVPEARQLLITPFDSSNANAIAKAIESANLNLHPKVDGHLIRINFPPMDESIRKEIVKQCKKICEDSKITIREVRRKFNDQVKKEKSSGDITEDMQKSLEKMIQELTDKYCKEIDNLYSKKEKEILEIA